MTQPPEVPPPTAHDAVKPFRLSRTVLWGSLLALGIALLAIILFLASPPGDGQLRRIVRLDRGESFRSFATELERQGVIRSDTLLVLQARLQGDAARAQAGVYQLDDGMWPGEILRKVTTGDVYAIRFAVPEGYSIYQVAELLAERRFLDRESFLAACRDPALLRELGIAAASCEGYLLPSTYDLTPGMAAADVVRLMVAQFRKVFDQEFEQLRQRRGLSVTRLLILASMVEKEAVVPVERPIIAAVFNNRLRRGMRLQSDPTAVYGVRAFAGTVTKADISRPSPYNTYLINGLPPGPIGNPGPETIRAVLEPAPSDHLYFVARRDGTHQFSRTLEEHNQAVDRFLKEGNNRKAPGSELRSDGQRLSGGR